MGLLNEVMYRPVDPARSAPRRAAPRPPGKVATAASGLLAVGLGIFTTSAILALRTPGDAVQESRSVLEREITERTADGDVLQDRVAELSTEIAALQSEALESANPELFAELGETELLSGALAVSGPGLVIELDDAETPAPADEDPDSRVLDHDLQILTNGLWAAGAEAIAINGQRLTALSAIRGAGQAILVDLAPLLPPYRIEAIGDPRALQTGFARSSAASYYASLTDFHGIQGEIRAAEELTLPGAGSTTLRYARAADADVASSASADQEENQ